MRTLGKIGDRFRARLFVALVALCLASGQVEAATRHQDSVNASPDRHQAGKDQPANFTADEMTYDKELGVVTAKGKVEVTHGGRVLVADTISYNQKIDLVSASGNVSLLEKSGEVLFADYMEVSGDLKDGVIRNFRMILKDGARVAAAGGRRHGGEKVEMDRAVYSPCALCAADPTRPPLWQVKAVKVTHDREAQRVEYRDAWMEMMGLPVAYTPYLQHADPTVKAASGFLAPSFGHSSSLGGMVHLPYYFAIAPNMDATFTPIYTSKEGPVASGEFRALPNRGKFKIAGSFTEDSNDRLRGHVASKGLFDIDRTWRWGFDVNRSTDDTYLSRYKFGGGENLVSNAFVEGFRQRNYFAANAYSFQDIRADVDSRTVPLVMPMLEYSHVGQPDRFGGRPSLDVNMLSLTRAEGTDTRRVSGTGGWELPHTSRDGSIVTLSTQVQADIYNISHYQPDPTRSSHDGTAFRAHPQAALEWRHPFVRRSERSSTYQMVEPTVQAVVSPNTSNKASRIPDEDSRLFEFDDTNLYTFNRYPGLDRLETGNRLNYGLQWGVFGEKGGSTLVRIGQSYRPRPDQSYANGSGLEDHFSDYVGSVTINPIKYVNLFYRTRLDKENFTPRRNEVQASVGPKALQTSVTYSFFDTVPGTEFPIREQISGGISSQLTQYWRATASAIYDIESSDTRRIGLGAIYEDECFMFNTQASRSFFHDRDLKPDNVVMFTITFKTLGEFRTGFTQSGE